MEAPEDYFEHADSKAHFFDAVIPPEGEVHLQHGDLGPSDIIDWMNQAGRYDLRATRKQAEGDQPSTIRIIHLPLARTPFCMSFSRETWLKLSTAFNLHPSTPHAFVDNNGAFAAYGLGDGDILSAKRIIMKVPNKAHVGWDALSLSFSRGTSKGMVRLEALVHGVSNEEWSLLVSRISAAPHISLHALYLPSLLFMQHAYRKCRYRDSLDTNIFLTEKETKYGTAGKLIPVPATSAGLQPPLDEDQELDLSALLRRLHSYQTELSSLTNVSKYSKAYGEFLEKLCKDDIAKKYASFTTPGLLNVGKLGMVEQTEQILEMLQLPLSQCNTILDQMQALRERVQSQTTLIFSLISQDENEISRLIAEQGAKVAIASKRDSTAMKTIALLTMLFLPATFVAAFLSMPMFDWKPDTGSTSVGSQLLWVYWVITIPLTLLLMISWRIWWTFEEKKSAKELEDAKRENKRRLRQIDQQTANGSAGS